MIARTAETSGVAIGIFRLATGALAGLVHRERCEMVADDLLRIGRVDALEIPAADLRSKRALCVRAELFPIEGNADRFAGLLRAGARRLAKPEMRDGVRARNVLVELDHVAV